MLIKIGLFIFVFIKLLFLVKIDEVSSCALAIYEFGCCNYNLWEPDCPGPYNPNCNIFDHNCVGCAYVYNNTNACSVNVYCSCYYCCEPTYAAESCPNGCRECVKDGEGGCPENSAVQFKSIGNSLSSSSMLETKTKARKQFDLIDVDKNGSISLNEAIDHLWPKLNNGTSAKHLTKKIPSWFAKINHNGNNKIEPGERIQVGGLIGVWGEAFWGPQGSGPPFKTPPPVEMLAPLEPNTQPLTGSTGWLANRRQQSDRCEIDRWTEGPVPLRMEL
uniref:EF-hand domain-containing protein n=1 Tax=Globodera rostochiensis TaxID=31243 RepID=A0A914I6G1_GLORO